MPDGLQENKHPVIFMIKTLKKAKLKWNIVDKECFAIFMALQSCNSSLVISKIESSYTMVQATTDITHTIVDDRHDIMGFWLLKRG